MSVINTVLKDLDNKPSAFTPLEIAAASAQQKQSQINPKAWIAGFILLTGLLVAVYFMYPLPVSKPQLQAEYIQSDDMILDGKSVAAPPSLKATQPVETSPINIEPVKKEAEITGLQLNETNDFLELSLQLPLGAQSFLARRSKNRYVFLISNSVKKIITPQVENNPWIKSIAVSESKEGLEIQFDTPDNILVETQHEEKGQYYYWVIRLKKSVYSNKIESLIAKNKETEILPETGMQPENSSNADSEAVKMKSESTAQQSVKLEIKPVKLALTDAELLTQATQDMQQRNWLKAQKKLQLLLGSKVDKKARIKLLGLYQLQQKNDPLNKLLSKSLVLYPDEPVFLIMHARQMFSDKKFMDLINRYNNKVNNKEIVNLVATSYQSINQHDEAVNYYQRSLKIDPQQPRIWISLAISQEQLSQFENALQSYRVALQSGVVNAKLKSFIQKRLQQLNNNTRP